jgi:AAA domain
MNTLACKPARDLPVTEEEQPWLVRELWAEEAVGVIGAEPKTFKTFLALELAVAVASGAPCLRRFPVSRPGCVLLYCAEDSLTMVRRRLEGICAAAGLKLEELDIQVITEPSVRLDLEFVRRRLDATVAKLRPRLLILDPFVRLHRIDENASGEVAPLLAFLRELQRRHALAVLVVHHAKKGAGRIRAGQALRGSSEFHAWGDTNLYLKKQGDDTVSLTVEHRAAPSIRPLTLELATNRRGVALRIVDRAPTSVQPPSSVDDRIIAALTASQRPLSFPELRGQCRTRSATVYERIAALTAIGRVSKSSLGYRLVEGADGRGTNKS